MSQLRKQSRKANQSRPTRARSRGNRPSAHSEAFFRTLWQNSGDLIFVVGFPDMRVEQANPTFQLIGFTPAQLVGREAMSFIHPEDLHILQSAIEEMLQKGSDGHVARLRCLDANGTPHHVEVRGCAVRNRQHRVNRFVVVARFIDDWYAAQERLREREQELQLLLDSTAEGIYGIDAEGKCTFCNNSCLKLLGYEDPTQLLGKNIREHVHPRDNQADLNSHRSALGDALRPDSVHVEDGVFSRADGTAIPAEYWSYPMWSEGKVVGRVVAFVDTAERKATEARLRQAHHEAELFINAVPSILIGLDARGCIRRWNSTAERTFGLTLTDVAGKPLTSCGIKWLSPLTHFPAALLDESKAPVKVDGVMFEIDGTCRVLGLAANWISLPGSGYGELLVVGADITDRKRAQDELGWKTAMLEAQVHASIDGILVVDEQSKVVLRNERLLDIFGIPEPLRGSNDDGVLLQHVQQQVENSQAFLEKIKYLYLHKHETSRDELHLKNGTVLDRYSSPVFGRDGEYYGRIWTFRDITHRKRNEDALRQLSVAVEQSPVSVVITDLKGDITYVNRRFSEVTGYSFEEAIGQNPRILKSDYTSSQEYQQLWETILRGEEWRGELRNKKKNGDLYWESVVIRPIRNSSGETSHFLAVKEDITEKKISEAHSRQAQKLEAIGQLAAGIAHEINTPIQFVGDNTRFVKESWGSLDPALALLQNQAETNASEVIEKVRRTLSECDATYLQTEVPRALDQSLEGIARVAKIVRAMKEFSHPGSDEKQLTDINKSILTTLTVARNEWKYVADVETVLAPDIELVPCHVSELNQVILNLLINSAHAIAEVVGDASKGKGKIIIRTVQEKDSTTISIADTGAGIPPEIQSKVFDPFFTTKGVGRGTGQGLSLAHNSIVKKHKGRIWFETEPGKGTTFFVQLPRPPKVS